jgi:hypothetical protein
MVNVLFPGIDYIVFTAAKIEKSPHQRRFEAIYSGHGLLDTALLISKRKKFTIFAPSFSLREW